jgi:hypothetical protein
MPDEDEKNLAAARALDSMPPDAPTVVTELPAELLEKFGPPPSSSDAPRPAAGVTPPLRPPQRLSLPKPLPLPRGLTPPLHRDQVPTPVSTAIPRDPGSAPHADEVDEAWADDDDDDANSEQQPNSDGQVDVEAPTVAAALDTSSLAGLPLPNSLLSPPGSGGKLPSENMPSPLASTVAPNSAAALQAMRTVNRVNPPGPAEAPWANPNAPRWQPPEPRPSLVDQPSAIGWAIGGIVVAIVLMVLVVWLVLFVFHNFIAH